MADRRAQRWIDWLIVLLLFAAALALRLIRLSNSPYGDESYYMFFAQHLAHYFDAVRYPITGSVMPVFPIAMHFFASSLTTLRIANATAGAALVPITIWVLRDLGVGRAFRYLSGAILALSATLVLFSWDAFLDTLGALIALLALWLYIRRSYRWAAVFVALAALEKEYLVFVGVAFFIDYLISRRRVYGEVLAAGAVVLAWIVVRYGLLGASFKYLLHGHPIEPLSSDVFLFQLRHGIGSRLLLPFVLLGAITSRRARPAAWYLLLFIAFLAIWRNVQQWYFISAVVYATILAACAGQWLVDNAPRYLEGLPPRLLRQGVTLGMILVFGLALYDLAHRTREYMDAGPDHGLLDAAAYVQKQPPPDLTLVRCFDGFRLFPFGDHGSQVTNVMEWTDVKSAEAVACIGAPPVPSGWHALYQAGAYIVVVRR